MRSYGSRPERQQLLSRSDFFIGTSGATVSRLIFLSQVGRLGYVPPYSFLDRPGVCPENAFCTSGKPCGCSWGPNAFGEEPTTV